jgi:hypothetical protein
MANYHLVEVGGSHNAIRFKSAVYDDAARTVILKPIHRLNLHNLFRLTVSRPGTSGQADPPGQLLNSSKTTADSGSDFVIILSAADLVLTTTNPTILKEYRKILLNQSAELRRIQTP